MLIAGFTIVAGWLRDWFAALAIIMAGFAVQAVISIPQLMATRRLNGLPPPPAHYTYALAAVAGRVVLVGLVFYLIGWGLRSLRDRWQ